MPYRTSGDGYKGKPSPHKNLKSCICFSRILIFLRTGHLIPYKEEIYILTYIIMCNGLISTISP